MARPDVDHTAPDGATGSAAAPLAGPTAAPATGAAQLADDDRAAPSTVVTPAVTPAVVIGLLVGSAFVMILNETIMSVALPVLVTDLAVTVTTAQWLTSGFLLTMAVVVPITGFLLQRFDPRTVYLTAMILFSLGTAICAVAPGFGLLMVGRVVQAMGTAVMIPLLMTTVLRLIPTERRGSVMGTITVVIAVAPAIGPTVSGLILSALSWRWMFGVVLPIALLALAAGARWLRLDSTTRRVPLDLLSVALSVLGFGGLVLGLSLLGEGGHGGEGGGAAVPAWVPAVVGVLALAVFAVRQRRLQPRDGALLDLRPLTVPPFVSALALVLLGMMAMFGVLILLPLYLQSVRGVDPLVTGLVVLPGGLVMGALGPVVGRLYDRFGVRPLVRPGAAVLAVALWGFAVFGTSAPLGGIVALHVVLVTGLSLMFTPLMTSALSSLPGEMDSHGSAIMATLQQVAAAAGTALFVTVLALFSQAPDGATDDAGAGAAFLVAAIIATIALPMALFLVGRGEQRPARRVDAAH